MEAITYFLALVRFLRLAFSSFRPCEHVHFMANFRCRSDASRQTTSQFRQRPSDGSSKFALPVQIRFSGWWIVPCCSSGFRLDAPPRWFLPWSRYWHLVAWLHRCSLGQVEASSLEARTTSRKSWWQGFLPLMLCFYWTFVSISCIFQTVNKVTNKETIIL